MLCLAKVFWQCRLSLVDLLIALDGPFQLGPALMQRSRGGVGDWVRDRDNGDSNGCLKQPLPPAVDDFSRWK